MNCLVLGGGGFIGSHLSKELLENGHNVTVFERPLLKINAGLASAIGKPSASRPLKWIEGDFTNENDIEEALNGIEIVFHLISTTLPKNSNDNPCYDIESNVVSTLKMLDAAVRHNVRKVIFISSGGTVYGIPEIVPIPETHSLDPICSYGITKLTIEKYLHLYFYLHGLDYCILRVSNPYGEWQRSSAQGVVTVFLNHALKNELIDIWGDGTVVRDYIHISDVINAMLKSMDYEGDHRIFNIGNNSGISLNDLLEIIESFTESKVKRVYKGARKLDVPVNVLDISRAREFLKWQPQVDLREGIKKTFLWMKSNINK